MTPPRIAIIGRGRMGREIESLARDRGWRVSAVIGHEQNEGGAGITRESLGDAQVAIEFTKPNAAAANVRACLGAGCAVVSGTTGWETELPAVQSLARNDGGALFWAPNFSIGIAILADIVKRAAPALRRSGFDAHIVETHHTRKLDAPSGTARLLGNAAAGEGNAIPITSVRTGHVPGTHDLLFDAPYEQILLRHLARDRRVFAAGALDAAQWLVGRRGVFTMQDMISTVNPE